MAFASLLTVLGELHQLRHVMHRRANRLAGDLP